MVHAPPRPAPGAPPVRVNLYSDTQTKPTAAMKAAMMAAEVGDEQAGTDPTVDALCATAWRRCSARKPRCSCRAGRCATRSRS